MQIVKDREKYRKLVRLYRGATTDGERAAADAALKRLTAKYGK